MTAPIIPPHGSAWNTLTPQEIRRAIRARQFTGHTTSLAPGYVQVNLVILPKSYASEFVLFCQRNPKPCPLLAMSNPGDPHIPDLGRGIDIRSDVPSYRIFHHGEKVEDIDDISTLWQEDFVTFALGCSFSFEEAILDAGLPLQHRKEGNTVAMYLANIHCAPAGRFHGKMVVSMRPFTPADAIKAIQITSRYPRVHGAPVHIGLPEMIGIEDINHAWQGDDPLIIEEMLPVFWACGVTPQSIILTAKPPICITHTPAHMLVTDISNGSLAVT